MLINVADTLVIRPELIDTISFDRDDKSIRIILTDGTKCTLPNRSTRTFNKLVKTVNNAPSCMKELETL